MRSSSRSIMRAPGDLAQPPGEAEPPSQQALGIFEVEEVGERGQHQHRHQRDDSIAPEAAGRTSTEMKAVTKIAVAMVKPST